MRVLAQLAGTVGEPVPALIFSVMTKVIWFDFEFCIFDFLSALS